MNKVLIPNRGEIAVRIIRAAHKLGLNTVVTISKLEKDTLPAQLSDEVHYFDEGPFEDNYLNIDLIIELAKDYGADCIHPGYGFLSENHRLAEACNSAGITFVGPSANNLKMMGDKQMARQISRQAGVSLTASWEGSLQSIIAEADTLPYPVLVKAAMGGGGKGMQICNNKSELLKQLPILSKQAQRYFGDERLYVEQYLPGARHIEVQVLSDRHGNHLHLFERECSVQRRFQKIIEEAPAPGLAAKVKERLFSDALRLCKAIEYSNAGTVEFLVDDKGQHYFLEMNTRIQVEHCVTEAITGIDLVEWQFRIARGETLELKQEALRMRGHAIELRRCAEDPDNNFQPAPGQIRHLILPKTKDVRVEIGFTQPIAIQPQFDPMIAKVIVRGNTREEAIQKAVVANQELVLSGIHTNGAFLHAVLQHAVFQQGRADTSFCSENIDALLNTNKDQLIPALAYVAHRYRRIKNRFWRHLPELSFSIGKQNFKASFEGDNEGLTVTLNDRSYRLAQLSTDEFLLRFQLDDKPYHLYCFAQDNRVEIIHYATVHSIVAHDCLPPHKPSDTQKSEGHNRFLAPIPSNVMKVNVKDGQSVKKGDLLMVLEAMKTENHIKAWKDGIIEKIHIHAGDQVKLNQALLVYKTD
ncbi:MULTISPECIES: acetyl/propionyl/methylcrotonyl-CoA carboxylase subunit alpha [unclassified Carboxylicivirga]|uniref:acetyl/propionyl/methylcrotonyl-CoA carboxylase subunit alpha n=1 Tax=Carboxylicivirga TaxID=1628153 RepID=UPI003D32F422